MNAQNVDHTGRGKALLAIAAALLLVLAIAYVLSRGLPSRGGGSRDDTLAIAVLPFGVEGPRPVDYIADGVTEGLIAQLSRLDALRVKPLSSVARYAGLDREPVDIGRELGVSAVVSGWVRARGEYLVVDARLVDVEDGRVLWEHRYFRLWDDLLLVEQKTAQYVVEALGIPLTETQIEEITQRSTDNGVAYELYLRASFQRKTASSPQSILDSIESFEMAANVDSTYAKAYAGLADALVVAYERGHLDAGACARAQAAARKAVELNQSLAPAHAALGTVRLVCDYDWGGAEQAYRQALQIDPRALGALGRYADLLAATDRVDEALAHDERAVAAEPEAAGAQLALARHLSQAGRYEAADTHFQKARKVADDSLAVDTAWLVSRVARGSLAADALHAAPAPSPGGELDHALAALAAGQADTGFERLQQMWESRSPALVWFFAHPLAAPYRQDERFTDLARRVGWPPLAQP